MHLRRFNHRGEPSYVKTDHPILVGTFDGFSWIRCVGKGSFLNSPAVKHFGDERVGAGEKRVVIDLGDCTGMDSTFMGTLAGIAARLNASGGNLEIADISERGRQSLEDLGLDCMMAILPANAPWSGRLQEIRSQLAPPRAASPLPGLKDRAKHVLDAHDSLAGADPRNSGRFAGVISILREDLGGDGADESR